MAESERPTEAEATRSRKGLMPLLTIDHLWLAVPIFITLGFGFLLKLRLIDFWWHLKAGEIIINTRSIPRTDLFSFTAAGQPFILQNWLVEVIYYATLPGGRPVLAGLR